MTISVKVIADSISESRQRITTFELIYPRFIHSEFMTHRLFSRNAASSRAIPVEKMIEQIENNPAMPVHWGKNQPGMQAEEELDRSLGECVWHEAMDEAIHYAKVLHTDGFHKQIVNRILEPFQHIKVVCTATEYSNFYHLRYHPDAQPEVQELARCMYEAREKSTPELLKAGEYHTPYVYHMNSGGGEIGYYTYDEDGYEVYLEEDQALKLSASLCAQVSYRKSDQSLEKALKIYDQLVTMKPVHASPFEHQASPMPHNVNLRTIGVTHKDNNHIHWSGNFKGWIQHRQLIDNHTCWEFEK